MGRYLIRRTLFLILVLFIVSIITFIVFVKLPSQDPAIRAAGRSPTPELIATIRAKFGLDQPIYVQFSRFARGLVPWPGIFLNEDVYFSYTNHVAVKEEIYSRVPVTATLALGAAVVWLALGLPIGIVSAIKPRSIFDRAGMIFALIGVSAPVFWLGLLSLYIFWYKLQWLPGSGIPPDENMVEAVMAGRFILPWFVLALSFAAFYSRMVRGNLIETMSEDYIRTARAKGISENRVIFKHGLRAALTPVVTMLGLDIGILLGGAVITETVFNLPGLGQYAVRSLLNSDFPAIMGVTIFAAFFICVANLFVDVAYAFLDPRVRYN
jgi:ABC-type dipeptide/oligopeptide/nickel transport systems, permease components